ncbi:MAG: NAD-dependent epimerase/dehydratase family protein [Aquabacterium sp.]
MSAHTSPPRVLVTGGAGFLGRHLTQQLLDEGHTQVRVLALSHEAIPPAWQGRVELHRGDITRAADVEQAVQGCDTVFHLAALVGDGASYADHERVTADGTAHVFASALKHQALVVLTTSICAYGSAIQRGACPEDVPPGAYQGPYSRAKQLQEQHAWQFKAKGGRMVIVRPANIIGPGCGPWVSDACHALRQGLPALISGGKGNAALAGVDNVADFLRLAARHPLAIGQAFHVHDGLDVTWARYFTDLASLLHCAPPRSVPRWLAYLGAWLTETPWRALRPRQRPPVTREALNLIAWDNRFPLDKARSLGWQPRLSYAQLLAAIAADIQARGL